MAPPGQECTKIYQKLAKNTKNTLENTQILSKYTHAVTVKRKGARGGFGWHILLHKNVQALPIKLLRHIAGTNVIPYA